MCFVGRCFQLLGHKTRSLRVFRRFIGFAEPRSNFEACCNSGLCQARDGKSRFVSTLKRSINHLNQFNDHVGKAFAIICITHITWIVEVPNGAHGSRFECKMREQGALLQKWSKIGVLRGN